MAWPYCLSPAGLCGRAVAPYSLGPSGLSGPSGLGQLSALRASVARQLSDRPNVFLSHAQMLFTASAVGSGLRVAPVEPAVTCSAGALPASQPLDQRRGLWATAAKVYAQFYKIFIFFPTMTPTDIRPSPYVTHTRRASACKISPPYVAPFRRR